MRLMLYDDLLSLTVAIIFFYTRHTLIFVAYLKCDWEMPVTQKVQSKWSERKKMK